MLPIMMVIDEPLKLSQHQLNAFFLRIVVIMLSLYSKKKKKIPTQISQKSSEADCGDLCLLYKLLRRPREKVTQAQDFNTRLGNIYPYLKNKTNM